MDTSSPVVYFSTEAQHFIVDHIEAISEMPVDAQSKDEDTEG